MKPITLRNLPPDVARAIQRAAQKANISANKAVIGLLDQNTKPARQKKGAVHHDLDKLAGAWSKSEADAFDRALKSQRVIDEDMWK
jgi:TRAP-type C4-dicarboxylate transport system substrate-binding protein